MTDRRITSLQWTHCTFTPEELKAYGLDGDVFPTEWKHPAIMSVEHTAGEYGWSVVIKVEDEYWHMVLGPAKGWNLTNDLQDPMDIDAVLVVPRNVTKTIYEPG